MHPADVILPVIIPALIILHLLIAPYTKVEESFNIQATHDIATHGIAFRNTSAFLHRNYDHVSFSGAVPRTFVGALALAGISKPLIALKGYESAQLIARAVLGLFNAFALLRYKTSLNQAFGPDVGRWYILLQAAQFHVIYYASRTLPNMFAFGLTTFAFGSFLPAPGSSVAEQQRRQKFGIFLFVLAGVIFRAEIAALLASQLFYLLVQGRISLQTIISTGIVSAIIALVLSVPIDSYFWQTPIWPELAGFYYNAVQGKSADWGTSPFTYYFSSLLPKLILNPLILLLLIPMGFALPAIKSPSRDLVIPSILFVAVYSLQPHKEARFIIYIVPALTAAASLSASYIWNRRSKTILYRLGSLLVIASIAGSFIASMGMLFISSLNYPGGDALAQFHDIVKHTKFDTAPNELTHTNVHMDVLSCMTGVTRFLQLPPNTELNGKLLNITYDKTEDEKTVLEPAFWDQFDYAMMEEPGKAIGKWEIVSTVFAYAGIEFLRPGDGSSFSENLERVYAANNLTKTDEQGNEEVLEGKDVEEAVEKSEEGKVVWDEEKEREKREINDLKTRLLMEEIGRFGTFKLVRDMVRVVTGGWWVGPRMEPRIRILKRIEDE
ncbi:glycosyltransferase family 22 protein [Mollisia scopiformis]|uniref:Mannosyltransferase n=1 Tax=Mollisia scopiformis TaxID=149040 RepID=A0A194XUU9_MOLSC|nr:glycosyltransferase family 22 protein [Mollisia scopiformis]KUJ23983.1 glycosyltransferase family 22 protein [Mollisia scopiformis]